MAFSSCSLSGSDGSDSDSGKRGKLQRCVSWTDDAGGPLALIREIDRVKRAPQWQALLSWSVLKEEVLATFGRGLEEAGGVDDSLAAAEQHARLNAAVNLELGGPLGTPRQLRIAGARPLC